MGPRDRGCRERIARRRGRLVAVGTTALRLLETAADGSGRIAPWEGETHLFLRPGMPIRTADLLLTNFHLPRSTLFMLVAAFAGLERMREAYAHAVRERYRFFSYGDACLLERADHSSTRKFSSISTSLGSRTKI